MNAKQWAVRGPGMPQMIVRADKSLTEEQVKKVYLSQIKARQIAYDSEVPWKIMPISDEEIQKANLGWCLKESRRKNHRGLIEVRVGKDGKELEIVEDVRVLPPVKKTRTKVDVTASPAK